MDNLSQAITESGTRNYTFKVEGKEDGQGYLTQAQQETHLGIILIQEWWGHNQSICKTADKFAQKGFKVLVPDVYRGKVAKNREQAGHYFQDLDWSSALNDIIAAGNHLKQNLGCKKVAITGFCLGGALAFAALASSNVFDAGAPFYGIPDLNKFPVQNMKAPIQAHFGSLDNSKGFSDPDSARNVEKQAQQDGLQFELIIWENGKHAFMNQDSENYDADIAQKALEKTTEFFKKILQ
ncbi:hypothetical protein IMG5_187330 [Ichthyophthirius multifiliis]|uniref:Dienelactone hydrolase domain-containing protein n=1 Tax=Ichthyophthirius multifiliis TaxID=5932 RepID=G0R3S2_ICHMU|nr:hypothetical protein IMG5_187330 [Ichthyophthirius multifiliis]EGR27889.1 hypothetical protein IMG5_187330 [Ichthyophthirius multifiliis]|eukprot:XP_004027234.1 hypothetical protein IMG5_187330 [Ichthyophthirius multifiliis]